MTTELDSQKRDELLYAIIDGYATEDEVRVFFDLCASCKKTLKKYEQEREVINFIRKNLKHSPLPDNFEERIRQNIGTLVSQ